MCCVYVCAIHSNEQKVFTQMCVVFSKALSASYGFTIYSRILLHVASFRMSILKLTQYAPMHRTAEPTPNKKPKTIVTPAVTYVCRERTGRVGFMCARVAKNGLLGISLSLYKCHAFFPFVFCSLHMFLSFHRDFVCHILYARHVRVKYSSRRDTRVSVSRWRSHAYKVK